MGIVADAVLGGRGEVIGVMTEQLVAAEVAHRGLTSLEIVRTMHERKARMAELSDGVIVLPGGFGTLDEAFEILTWNQLGLIAAPVVFLDVLDYFESLFDFVDRSVAAGFVGAGHARLVQRTELGGRRGETRDLTGCALHPEVAGLTIDRSQVQGLPGAGTSTPSGVISNQGDGSLIRPASSRSFWLVGSAPFNV